MGSEVRMKRLLVADPAGARLYELSEEEYARFEHLLLLERPAERGVWASRFLREREPLRVFPPGSRGLSLEEMDELGVDRAVGGNYFTPKWGRIQDGRGAPDGPT